MGRLQRFNCRSINDGFVRSAGGTITTFDLLGAGTAAFQGTSPSTVNALGAIVGITFDASNVSHGFVPAAGGGFTTFDVPATASHGVPGAGTGAFQGTFPIGNNLEGQMTGYYIDSNGVYHGFVLTP